MLIHEVLPACLCGGIYLTFKVSISAQAVSRHQLFASWVFFASSEKLMSQESTFSGLPVTLSDQTLLRSICSEGKKLKAWSTGNAREKWAQI